MTTGLLQNQTWDVGRAAGQCSACSASLTPGAVCWAALVEMPKPAGDPAAANTKDKPPSPWQRLDFCQACWTSGKRPAPPADMFSYWKTVVPEPEKKRRIFVDDSVLMDLFNRLADRTDMTDVRFRFVLALLLMRKKLLKYEGIELLPPDMTERFKDLTPIPELWKMFPRQNP
ncbi:MAG TPA: hypothetical protein VKJ65_09615, partial [Phycisphaerae bacterium]|nr:hypothetical protein [Phycisphaerae bacterium]